MKAAELEEVLLTFVNERLLGGATPVTPTDHLFEDGHLDSVRVLELIAFLEKTIGRKVPDRLVRLATFRSVRAMALTFGADGVRPEAERRFVYHTVPERFTSPVEELRRRGELVEPPTAVPALSGIAGELFTFFDATFARWARELGADDMEAPAAIDLATLERAGALASFPHLLVHAPQLPRECGLTTAACYHRYAALADREIAGVQLLGVRATCYRVEPEPRPLERLQAFTMREIVVVGGPQDVERALHRVLQRMDRFVTSLALDGSVEPANDPFFTSVAAERAVAQRAGDRKLELRLTLEGGRSLAAASLNRHGDHFGRAFAMTLDGRPAHSGCAAFGIERWVLAFLTQHGFAPHRWPDAARDGVAVQRSRAQAS